MICSAAHILAYGNNTEFLRAENRSEDDSENTIKKHCKGDCTMRILFSALIEMDSVSKKVHVKNKL